MLEPGTTQARHCFLTLPKTNSYHLNVWKSCSELTKEHSTRVSQWIKRIFFGGEISLSQRLFYSHKIFVLKLFKMGANQTDSLGLERGLPSKFWWLTSANHANFIEECVMCTEKHVLVKIVFTNKLNMGLPSERKKTSPDSENTLILV